jgi:hypothetical protein
MLLRTVVKDCLYVNWALPREALPALPGDLRYELHPWTGGLYGFVSALFFRQSGLRFSALPWIRVSHPQLNVRFYVVDGQGVPSVLFHALIVPRWVVPLARVTGQRSLSAGRFRYPRPSRAAGAASWTWRAAARGRLEVVSCPGAAEVGVGPDLGSWPRRCDYFRRRDRGYVSVGGRLRRIETVHSSVAVWPMRLEVKDHSLLRALPGMERATPWPEPHSSWLCPDMPLNFVLGDDMESRLPSQVPAPG